MMTTKQWRIVEEQSSEQSADALSEQLAEAAQLLRTGKLVAFPTETVYGIGADARNSDAVSGIFKAKGRPSDNPLIVHIADVSQLNGLVHPYPQLASRLMEQFWPGPLTIVLPVLPDAVSPLVTAGLATVGVRMPDHTAALALIRGAGCPVAAPSANRSGRPSPTTAAHVLEDLDGAISGIVDGGPTGVGLESTVVELTGPNAIRILRPGGITAEQLRHAVPEAEVDAPPPPTESAAAEAEAPRSPGMKYTHYAPRGVMEIVQGDAAKVAAYIEQQVAAAKSRGEKTGVLAFAERAPQFAADAVLSYGSESQLAQAAQRLYAALRQFDAEGVQRIWAEGCEEQGIGMALMNRLAKAAGNRITQL
ncbi:L-threonylcarbamoyladenylate synthase [Paenibacillus sp. NEAU-GSW1]|uniref:L-threonylcarbamoyladenylate synthase n=1 Tax=Paenibacillus sp. NEAU-GSW1 TaxID=2682486 RepID=UPI0012E1DEAC|nr:L-threonylcarbamoyladenylate synthase [Paenibacillus sp. NEAU-GSW1]MUT65102.1 threonylcarbamoyl-AMP synthase [Paenibacillus sp. NEAU-GSW1]